MNFNPSLWSDYLRSWLLNRLPGTFVWVARLHLDEMHVNLGFLVGFEGDRILQVQGVQTEGTTKSYKKNWVTF